MPSEIKLTITQITDKNQVLVDFDWNCQTATELETVLLEAVEQAIHSCLEIELDGSPIEIEEEAPMRLQ